MSGVAGRQLGEHGWGAGDPACICGHSFSEHHSETDDTVSSYPPYVGLTWLVCDHWGCDIE